MWFHWDLFKYSWLEMKVFIDLQGLHKAFNEVSAFEKESTLGSNLLLTNLNDSYSIYDIVIVFQY